MGKVTLLPTDNAPTLDDYLMGVDMAGPTSKKIKLSTLLSIIYPVGCLYTEVSGTNPATTFGFGTWVAFGAGKALVGVDSSDGDFSTPESTTGAKTVSLTGDQNGSHGHGVNDGGHRHNLWSVGQEGNSYPLGGPSTRVVLVGANSDAGNGVTGFSGANISIQGSGSGAPHNNVQPSIAIYVWKRTA